MVAPPSLFGQATTAVGSTFRSAVMVDGVVQSTASDCDSSGCTTYLGTVPWQGKRRLEAIRNEQVTSSIWIAEENRSGEGVESEVRRLVSDAPVLIGDLTVCGGGSGASVLMYQSEGSVVFVDPEAEEGSAPRSVRVGSASWSAPASAWSGDCSELFLVGDGRARFVRLAGSGVRRSLLSSTDFVLPTEVRRNASGLTLETPTVRRLDADRSLIVIGPRTHDHLRLESILFEPSPAVREWLEGGGSRQVEPPDDSLGVVQAWSRLPAPEEVLESSYLDLHGRPVLLVVSKEADKVGLLERKKIRLFELSADRTRSGRTAFFSTITSSRLWQTLDIEWIDLNQDGLRDLVLLQPEGLAGEALLVDVHLATGPLRLATKAQRSRLKTDQNGWTLRHDWTGDGLPDVLVLNAGLAQIYPLTESRARRGNRRGSYRWSETPESSFELADPPLPAGDSGSSVGSIRRRMWADAWGVVIASNRSEEDDEGLESDQLGPIRSIVEILRPAPSRESAQPPRGEP